MFGKDWDSPEGIALMSHDVRLTYSGSLVKRLEKKSGGILDWKLQNPACPVLKLMCEGWRREEKPGSRVRGYPSIHRCCN